MPDMDTTNGKRRRTCPKCLLFEPTRTCAECPRANQTVRSVLTRDTYVLRSRRADRSLGTRNRIWPMQSQNCEMIDGLRFLQRHGHDDSTSYLCRKRRGLRSGV